MGGPRGDNGRGIGSDGGGATQERLMWLLSARTADTAASASGGEGASAEADEIARITQTYLTGSARRVGGAGNAGSGANPEGESASARARTASGAFAPGGVGGGSGDSSSSSAAAVAVAVAADLGGGGAADPEQVETLKAEGNAALKAKQYTSAVRAYERAIALCPAAMAETAGTLHSNLSNAYGMLGDATAALAAADAAAASRPQWEKAHFRRGEALFALQRYDEAVEAYSSALACKPGDAHLRFATSLAREASKGGVWFRQLSPGREIATSPGSELETLVFGAAARSRNFIYLLGCATTRECYCVDPAWDTRGIAAVCARHKMRLVGALGTHYHFDHIGGFVPPQLQAMVYGPFGRPRDADGRLVGLREMRVDHGAKLYAQSHEISTIARQIGLSEGELTPLEHGTRLPLGGSGALEILHTCGHSPGSLCVRVLPTDTASREFVLTGDTVFPGSCGRLDMPDASKDAMFDSLAKLRTLDSAVKLYPGHGYSGEVTTVGQEKAEGMLRPFNKESFLQMFA